VRRRSTVPPYGHEIELHSLPASEAQLRLLTIVACDLQPNGVLEFLRGLDVSREMLVELRREIRAATSILKDRRAEIPSAVF
jgi:hypothetical protein